MRETSDGEALIEKTPFDVVHPVLRNYRKTGRLAGRKKSSPRIFDVWKPDVIGGEHRWRCVKERLISRYRNKPGFPSFKKTGTPCGMTRKEACEAWKRAKEKALQIMAQLKSLQLIHEKDIEYKMVMSLAEIGVCDAVLAKDRIAACKAALDHIHKRQATVAALAVATAAAAPPLSAPQDHQNIQWLFSDQPTITV